MTTVNGSGVIDDARREELAAAFRAQGGFCRKRDADFTAAIVDAAGAEIESGGPLLALADAFRGEPVKNALALRVAGALHALVLDGRAGDLEAYYAAPDAAPDADDLRKAMAPLWTREREVFARYIAKAPQTNETRRAAALLPGFCKVAETFGLPLDILEMGASAGMLLGWDRFRYDYKVGDKVVAHWTPEGASQDDAGVDAEWRGKTPPQLHAPVRVRRRKGCDLHPFDLSDPDQLLHARSYIWPEDKARRDLFDMAVRKNAKLSTHVEKADALEWLERELGDRADDAATVVYHSVFAPYLTDDQRARKQALLEAAGESATTDAPLALLSFEPTAFDDDVEFLTELQIWPADGAGGRKLRLARSHPHGAWVEPLGDF